MIMTSIRNIAAAAVFASAALFASGASAQDQARTELAREMITSMQIEATITDMLTTMSPMVAQAMAQELRLTPSQTARLGELLAEEFRAEVPSMLTQMTAVYANDLSEQELRDIVTFLRSPSGRAMIETQNTAQDHLGRIGQAAGMSAGFRALTRLNQEMAR